MASGPPPPYAPADPSKGYPPSAPYGPQNPGYPPPGVGYPPQGAGYPPGGYPPAGAPPAGFQMPYQPNQPVMMPPQQQQQQQSVVVIGTGPAVTGNCPVCRSGHLVEEFTCCGICLAIFFFPIGLICCLLMRDRRCTRCGARI